MNSKDKEPSVTPSAEAVMITSTVSREEVSSTVALPDCVLTRREDKLPPVVLKFKSKQRDRTSWINLIGIQP